MSFYDEDAQCPKCLATKLKDPSLTLLVNVCGHPLCKKCVEMMFVRGSAACPECQLPLKRADFRLRLFDDVYVEKELEIRRRVSRDFNKREDDFDTTDEYNDYLEMVETLIYNLANNIDVRETKEIIERYKRENKESIKRNKFKKSKDDEVLESLIAEESERAQQLNEASNAEKAAEKRRLQNDHEALIEELITSNATADEIIESHIAVQQANAQAHTAMTTAQLEAAIAKRQQTDLTLRSAAELLATARARPRIESGGLPMLLEESELDALADYKAMLRPDHPFEVAGGFSMALAARRILNEAFNGLFIVGGTNSE